MSSSGPAGGKQPTYDFSKWDRIATEIDAEQRAAASAEAEAELRVDPDASYKADKERARAEQQRLRAEIVQDEKQVQDIVVRLNSGDPALRLAAVECPTEKQELTLTLTLTLILTPCPGRAAGHHRARRGARAQGPARHQG